MLSKQRVKQGSSDVFGSGWVTENENLPVYCLCVLRSNRACYSAVGCELLLQLLKMHSVSSSRKEGKTCCPSNKEQDSLSFGTQKL
jgi:hypothetical protein